MFGSVKKMLGIEGVKLELIIPEKVDKHVGLITGFVKLTSLSDNNLLEYIHIVMIEKYSRGKKDNQLVDEYPMGRLTKEEKIMISKNDVIEIPFEMSFMYVESEMDKLEQKNFISRSVVRIAKKIKGVKSEYYVKAEAGIKGTKLIPFDKKTVQLI